MRLTPQQVAWLKGAEMAVAGAVASVVLQSITAGFPTTKAGWWKFATIVAGSAYGALRLYMTQSPIQDVLVVKKTTETLQQGDKTLSTSETTAASEVPPTTT
jgi:hypothetical protein